LAAKKEESVLEGILPIKDSYVNSAYPDTNYGADPRITTAYTNSSKIIFIEFNLEPITFVNPEQKAYLKMHLESSNTALEPVEMEILLPSKNWNEGEICWNNKPSLYSSGLTASFEATPGAQLVDVTSLVKKWINKEVDNNGIAFYYNGIDFMREFASKETEKNKPQLIMEGMPESLLQKVRVLSASASSENEKEVKKTEMETEKEKSKRTDILGISQFELPEINLQFIYDRQLWAMGLWVIGLGFLLGGWRVGKKMTND
jgi:hypothetical protein